MKKLSNLIITAFLIIFSPLSCATEAEEELPMFPVELRIGGSLPAHGMVGEYTVSLEEGWIIVGDLTIYGMDRTEAGFLFYSPNNLKHAGHIHGEADSETSAEGCYVIDLTTQPQSVATNMVTEGHYFDGKIRIRPADNIYLPIWPATRELVSSEEPIWGHSFILNGSAFKDENEYQFEITISMESLITGLVYGGTVKEGGANTITTLLNLEQILAHIDFEALADPDNLVTINEENNIETLLILKTELKNPENFFHLEAETIPDE